MAGSFACPECGCAVVPRGLSPGRQLRCGECGTLVEVPFLPRATGPRRTRRHGPGWTWAVLGIVAAVLMVVGSVEIARSRGRAGRERKIAALVSASEKAEASSRYDEALADATAGLKIAKTLGADATAPLKERRDRLALRDAETRLAGVEAAPDQVEALRALRVTIESDRALEPLRDTVVDALSVALARRAGADLNDASSALASGHPQMAINLCERVAKAADELGYERAEGLKEAARRVAESVIRRVGVTFEPVTGEFLQGPSTARLHAESLYPNIASALARRGYLPKPKASAFLTVWDETAPFKVALSVVERNDGNFFQTPLHTSRLQAILALKQGKAIRWQTQAQGKTRLPPPTMTAFEQSHLTLAKTRDPAIEKRLYDDARAVLAENLGGMLRTMPEP
ncbi:MAG: hypothetical protein JWN86_3045 [Planctomycetota bacterium]|nr:hypothetical protein [Planctomycetota bacterium]